MRRDAIAPGLLLDRLVEADWAAYFWADGRRPAVAAYWERWRARASHRDAIAAARCAVTRRGIADLRDVKAADARLRDALEGPQRDGAWRHPTVATRPKA